MKMSTLAGIVPLLLISASGFAQSENQAVPRGTGGGSSDAGSRHTGGSSQGGSSASSNSGSGGGSSANQGGGSYAGAGAPDAAGRRPRPGTGTGNRGRNGESYEGGRYNSYPYSNYYYDPYYYSYGWGSPRYGRYGNYYGYNDYGYFYGDYYGYNPGYSSRSYRYRSGNVAQLRTMVEPAKTRVYVDGYYAGIADDFDGLLQRLNISPGRHEITLKLEGFTSHTFSVYANRDQTLKLRWDMVRGSGETRDSVGEERADRGDRGNPDRDNDDARDLEMDRDRERERVERPRESDLERERRLPAPRDGARGEVIFEIDPPDASIYVDGEFYGKASQVTRLELSAGAHRIEVVRPGYRTEETEVQVDGDTRKVVVRLERR